MKFSGIFAALLLCLSLVSCDDSIVYKAHEDIDDGLWYIKNKPAFKIEITDTTQVYNLYYLLRNTLQYPYYNLYLTRNFTGPDKQLISNTLEEVYLSNEMTGKPYGHGLGDLFDHKIPFLKNYRFSKSGIYTITLSQSMRQNPLPFVMSVGISVEKVQVNK
ncbi:gliding motility lipoprotein GldH [Dyadobacter aurulentus]|uniref:gliding motility lipoprotein GldH n=1 Tax=Dyadobacter sp. UC 10 TaxID=2605428 RepID=UPI0011F34BE4|nr:gliding motility lipoprotein GldH [Dyadobacter sp. UC 10]KAA0990422.1 gliding motility lipoprotein GldH [Dyadobacter sp. UC 10]